MRGGWGRVVASLVLLACLLAGCGTGNSDLPPQRVLFIGNSYTDFNGGIDQVLRGLAPRTEVERITVGGYRLAQHLAQQPTVARLRDGGWSHVVLQEQSQTPVWGYSDFVDAAGHLVKLSRKAGAEPLLLQTWSRPDSGGVTTAALEAAFDKAGTRLKVTVVPAGRAFALAHSVRPDLVLNATDGHPTREGTYLAGCAVYATIFRTSPLGNSFTGGVDPETARLLQAMAARAVEG